MNRSEFTYLYEVDATVPVTLQIGVRADPSLDETESFAAVLYFQQADGTQVEVAKIDNAEHEEGTVHIDRYYREVGAEIKDFSVDIDGWKEADKYLNENAEHYAQTYLRNHGAEPRNDVENY